MRPLKITYLTSRAQARRRPSRRSATRGNGWTRSSRRGPGRRGRRPRLDPYGRQPMEWTSKVLTTSPYRRLAAGVVVAGRVGPAEVPPVAVAGRTVGPESAACARPGGQPGLAGLLGGAPARRLLGLDLADQPARPGPQRALARLERVDLSSSGPVGARPGRPGSPPARRRARASAPSSAACCSAAMARRRPPPPPWRRPAPGAVVGRLGHAVEHLERSSRSPTLSASTTRVSTPEAPLLT